MGNTFHIGAKLSQESNKNDYMCCARECFAGCAARINSVTHHSAYILRRMCACVCVCPCDKPNEHKRLSCRKLTKCVNTAHTHNARTGPQRLIYGPSIHLATYSHHTSHTSVHAHPPPSPLLALITYHPAHPPTPPRLGAQQRIKLHSIYTHVLTYPS